MRRRKEIKVDTGVKKVEKGTNDATSDWRVGPQVRHGEEHMIRRRVRQSKNLEWRCEAKAGDGEF